MSDKITPQTQVSITMSIEDWDRLAWFRSEDYQNRKHDILRDKAVFREFRNKLLEAKNKLLEV